MSKITLVFYAEILPGDAERTLAQLGADPRAQVEVRINSPGGVVTEALAIYNALKSRKPIVFIDGIAASCASLIAMAGKPVIAAENALIMLHDPWSDTTGNADELRHTADVLDQYSSAMIGAYAAHTGKSRDEIAVLMAAETWLTAHEALAAGFIDEIAEALPYAAHARSAFATFHNVPRILKMAETTIAQPNNPVAATAAATTSAVLNATDTAAATVMAALQERNNVIACALKPIMGIAGVRELYESALLDPRMTLDAVNAKALALAGAGASPSASHITVNDQQFDFIAAASDAIAIRAGVRVTKPHAGARDLRNTSIADIARACLSRGGRSHGELSRANVVRAALSTGDFPNILENSLGKALRVGFEDEPSSHDAWVRKSTVQDFKPQSRVILGSAPELKEVLELGEYELGDMAEDKSVAFSVIKFGRLIAFSFEALMNDDLGAFARTTSAMGQAAKRVEADNIYALITANAGAGQTMQDNVSLFHADHMNLAAAAAALDSTALGAGRALLRKQTAVGGGLLNLTPRTLLVPAELEEAAETVLAASARLQNQGSDQTLVPAWVAGLTLVVEPRLSPSAAFLMASPTQIDTVELAYLESDNGPIMTQHIGFTNDAVTYKIRHIFGARFLDWRGIVKIPVGA